ncbi:MAG: hypothetical protein F4066_00220 [Chloroflexi bacterium]|nr:hypothetical protein [Chloroflexota bacterium]MYF82493.1 hypothetical protein [Chloroflexota bacterium]MYI03275.1 hypothetical protein [Chloroflexota bacterium]
MRAPRWLRSGASGWVAALVGALTTLGVQALTRTGEIEVRINAMRESDGDVQFALQQRQPDGAWGERQEPRVNRLPASHSGRWANSSPVSVTWEIEIEQDEKVVAAVSQIENIGGVAVAVDRYMEVETVSTDYRQQTTASTDSGGSMEAGDAETDYWSFCRNPFSVGWSTFASIDGGPARALSEALWEATKRELSSADWLDLLGLEIAMWEAVTPPARYQLFHQAMLAGLRSVYASWSSDGTEGWQIRTEYSVWPFLSEELRTRWASGFPADQIQTLKAAGCIAAPELEGGLMDG